MILSPASRFAFVALFWCVWHLGHADTRPVTVTDASPIQAHFQYVKDPDSQADLQQILQRPDDEWQTEPTGNATMGITDAAYWLRFAVVNPTDQHIKLIAELAYAQLDDVTFYLISDGRLQRELTLGDTHPFYPRDVDHPHMALRFSLAPGETKTLYARVQTDGSMILPLRIWREQAFFEDAAREQKLHFLYYGGIIVIILINLAVFLTLREKLYLYYAIAISGYLLFFSSIHGYSFQHFYPQSPAVHGRVLLLSMPLLALFSLLFCREFLKIKGNSPKLDIAMRAMIGFEILNLIAAATLSYNVAIKLSTYSSLFFFSLLLVAGPIRWAAGVRAAKFFTVAWSPLTIGVLATAGRAMGFLPEHFLTEYAMQIGSGLEAFILTLALADRLYREREDKIQAQAESLRKEKAQHEAHNRLTDAMMHDPVTQLPNRNRFEWMVNRRFQRDPEGQYMVGVTRVTRLDEINRTLGLTRSEMLLQRLAEQMSALAHRLPYVHKVRDDNGREECVYQLAGDCFGILVDVSKVNDEFKELNRALEQLSQAMPLDNLAIELHPKFGAAIYPTHGDNAALLIRNAHVGMESVPAGKVHVGFYSPDYDIYSESRLTLMSDLREALNNDQTELYYQPKISLVTGDVVGVEALIRWHHPERGWVTPVEFIPLAEETGVIAQLTRWAFERSMRDLAQLLSEQPHLEVSINISARDLASGSLGHHIQQLLAQHGIAAERITLELTETAAMEDPRQGLKALHKLADIGLRVAIDDFGSGYSSLSYLKQLPATEIKLDRSLVMDVCASESSRMIVETAINMVHGLDYQLVAEGVEDEATARLLKALGCDRIQGFWLCRPLPADQLPQWLATYRAVI
ncbi:EAL domain-containing protein [Marinobacteraceae bacterium S3BR75-40.1]